MKHIVVGTDRPDSNTQKVADYIAGVYAAMGEQVGFIQMSEAAKGMIGGPQYGTIRDERLKAECDKVLASEGLIVVVPEYNGSYPGILKYFIDHLKFPEAFEYRPVC